jgi:hypothetical protein
MFSIMGICTTIGLLVGGYVPELWGASAFSLQSVLFGAVGGVAGVVLAKRLTDV